MSARGGFTERANISERDLYSGPAGPPAMLPNPASRIRGVRRTEGTRGALVSESVWKRIEESRAKHNVLEHPFYVKWSAGELSSDELARYSGQYRHATEALAKLTADTATLAPDSRRDEMERHASEEQEHIGLWDDFVEAAGGEIGAEPTPETAECVQTWTARKG